MTVPADETLTSRGGFVVFTEVTGMMTGKPQSEGEVMPASEDEIDSAVVELDEYLRRTEDGGDDRRPDGIPIFYLDQLDAARKEIFDGFKHGVERTVTAPESVRLKAIRTVVGWVYDSVATCTHQPDVRSPQPVFAAEWRPEVVVCRLCVRILGRPPAVCTVCHEPTESDAIMTLVLGTLVYTAQVCDHCANTLE